MNLNLSDLKVHVLQANEEIVRLRRRTELLEVENSAYDRILSALEAHRPRERTMGASEDVVPKLAKDYAALDKLIESGMKVVKPIPSQADARYDG
jgi:hypothetical protein